MLFSNSSLGWQHLHVDRVSAALKTMPMGCLFYTQSLAAISCSISSTDIATETNLLSYFGVLFSSVSCAVLLCFLFSHHRSWNSENSPLEHDRVTHPAFLCSAASAGTSCRAQGCCPHQMGEKQMGQGVTQVGSQGGEKKHSGIQGA